MATDTMPRTPGVPNRPGAPSRPGTPRRATPPGRGTTPKTPKTPKTPRAPGNPADTRTRPVNAPRHTRPVPRGARPRRQRAPFILLLVGLLGGALVSLLVISTTLAQGSFQITNLQQQNNNLARQEQLLSQQVAQASSPAQIAREATAFGMQQNPNLQFINLKTGKIIKGRVSKTDAAINVPGYTP
jgi:cell division protein FtsL